MNTLVRINETFNKNWLYFFGDDACAGAEDFEDKEWRKIELPHDYATEHEIYEKSMAGKGGGYVLPAVSWYRKHFEFDKAWQDKKVSLLFDGVIQASEVYVNGTKVYEHNSGYTPFEIELNDYLKDGDNVIALRVDNLEQPCSRWYAGAGIYRDVNLIVTNKLHINKWGVFALTNNIHPELDMADVEIQTLVNNETNERQKIKVLHTFYDANGEEVTSSSGQIAIAANSNGTCVVLPKIPECKVWSVDSPYLYTIKTEIIINGEVIDDYVMKLGVCLYEFNNKQGFLLNGKQIKIKGMCLHHDGGLTGSVGYKETWVRRIKKLKEMGCNAIRCAHNPPSKIFLDLCDEMGMLIMNEAFDEWYLGKVKNLAEGYSLDNTAGYNTVFHSEAGKDLETMLLRDRNHPSIIIWSIGNEILDQSTRYGYRTSQFLIDICHKFDPTRPVTCACSRIQAAAPLSTFRSYETVLDVVGYNYTGRWRDRAQTLYDQDRELYPERVFIGTENPCAGGLRGNYDINDDAKPDARNREYTRITNENEHIWKYIASHDFVSGDFFWAGIDYLGEAFWPNKNSSSGPIDTAGFEKDTYYYFRSIWNNDATTLHIAPHWNWSGKEGEFIPVIAYTNCAEVALYLNDKLISRKGFVFPRFGATHAVNNTKVNATSTTSDLHLSWDVPYIAGELKAVGYNVKGEIIATTIVKTTSQEAKTIEVVADAQTVSNEALVNFEISLSDKDGLHIPTATDKVECIMHEGTLIGMDNGDPTDHTLFAQNSRNLFAGKVLVLAKANENGISFTLKCGELTKEICVK